MSNLFLTIIMPACNEEENILPALEDTLSAFREFGINGEILVVNDGSTDSTPLLVRQRAQEFPDKIRMIEHPAPQGIGASFRDGVEGARGNIVCMLPGDNENDPGEILRYIGLLNNVDIVIPFVFNKEVRPRSRNFLSSLYRMIINITFLTSLNYTNGTTLYRKSLLKELPGIRNGFFFQTDILMRLVKNGYLFAEVPYRLRGRKKGRSKAVTLNSLKEVMAGYLGLVRDIYFKRRKAAIAYAADSVSAGQYKELAD